MIGYTPVSDDRLLKSMRGEGAERASRLAIIPYANTVRESSIRDQFAHLVVEPGKPIFQPAADLIDFIDTHANEWELPIKAPLREPKKSKMVERTCEGCGKPYRTGVGYRYCSNCQSISGTGCTPRAICSESLEKPRPIPTMSAQLGKAIPILGARMPSKPSKIRNKETLCQTVTRRSVRLRRACAAPESRRFP